MSWTPTFWFPACGAGFHAIRDDPDDNRFLECAVAGHAEVIVSGDRHLIALSSFRTIPTLTPAVFIKRFPRTSSD